MVNLLCLYGRPFSKFVIASRVLVDLKRNSLQGVEAAVGLFDSDYSFTIKVLAIQLF